MEAPRLAIVRVRRLHDRMVQAYPDLLVGLAVGDFGHLGPLLPLPQAEVHPLHWRRHNPFM